MLGEWGKYGKRVVNADWKKPLAWDRAAKRDGVRRRVFPSLCDPFEDRDDLIEPRLRFLHLIASTPHLDWLVLTKRPEVARRILCDPYMPGPICDYGATKGEYLHTSRRIEHEGGAYTKILPVAWPFPNLWLGVSVEDQARAADRIPKFLEIPNALPWISVEPLIGPVDLSEWLFCDRCCNPNMPCGRGAYETPLDNAAGGCWFRECRCSRIDWVVVGGESGPNARPCDLAWIRSIVAQCRDAGVPVYVKQLGSKPFDSSVRVAIDGHDSHAVALDLRHPKGGDPEEWPEVLRVREYPRQAKGGQP